MHSLSCLRRLVLQCPPVRHDQRISPMAAATMSSRSSSNLDRNKTLDQSWSQAADLYLRALVPRFIPWLLDGVQILLNARDSLPPHLPALLPCCGPGHEIPLLYRCFKGHHPIHASDLSGGMVQLSKQVISADTAGLLQSHDAHNNSSAETQHGLGLQQSTSDASQGVNTVLSQDALHAVSNVLRAACDRFGSEVFQPVKEQHVTGTIAHSTTTTSSSVSECSPPMLAEQLDAAHLDQQYSGKAAAVFSVFGLQQLGPLAPQVLCSWGRCLAPGGLMVVVMWPSTVEPAGLPWSAYDQALKEQVAAEKQVSGDPQSNTGSKAGVSQEASMPKHNQASDSANTGQETDRKLMPWEQQLLTQLMQEHPDYQVVSDEYVRHEMSWADADECWQVMTYGGPWHARRLVSGDDFMDQLKQRWMAKLQFPALQCAMGQQLVHHPTARIIVVRRPATALQSPRL